MDSSENVWITEWFEPEEGYQLTKKAIESNLPDAFLYASDELALGGYRAFSESGIQVGKDISIVSIDNLPYASYLTPPLTTVALNMALLGKTAAMALDSQIRGRDYPLTFFTPVELIKRESCVKKRLKKTALSGIPGTDMVITAKSRRKMFRRRISKCFRNLCNLFLRIGKQNGSGRHTGFCLFLLEGFSIIFHQKTLRLSGTELQPVGRDPAGKDPGIRTENIPQ